MEIEQGRFERLREVARMAHAYHTSERNVNRETFGGLMLWECSMWNEEDSFCPAPDLRDAVVRLEPGDLE
jgi:hypothetical protein